MITHGHKKLATIKHFPFKWAHTAEEVDGLLAEECLRAGQDTQSDLKSLPGHNEFLRAAEAIQAISETVEAAPENLPLLHHLAFHAVRHIDSESSIDPAAPRCLIALAQYIIGLLQLGRDEYLKEIAHTRLHWPCLVSLKDLAEHRIKKRQAEFWVLRDWLEGIELGRDCSVKELSGVETNRLAKLMIEAIEQNRRRLTQRKEAQNLKKSDPAEFNRRFNLCDFPEWAAKCGSLRPLKKGAWKEWFEIGWEALLDATDGHPERYKSLRRFGQYRENAYKQKDPENAKRKDTTKTKDSLIRDGIKSQLRAAFQRLSNG